MDQVVVHDPALYSRGNHQHSQVCDLLTTLFVRALGYTPNPRNLEAHWKPMYSLWFVQMTYGHQNLDCFQEQPVWCTTEGSNLSQNPDKSITAGEGKFLTLYPDLGIVRVGRKNDKWLLIGELKRSPKRGFIFNVDLKHESEGWIDLRAKVTSAIRQVQSQAYIALGENPNQKAIVLFAASGPFWTYVVALRTQINALFIEYEEPSELAESLVELKDEEGEEGEDEEDEDDQEQKQANNVAKGDAIGMISDVAMTRKDFFYWDKELDDLRKKSKKTQKHEKRISALETEVQGNFDSSLPWANIMFAGTVTSNEAMKALRKRINELAAASWAEST